MAFNLPLLHTLKDYDKATFKGDLTAGITTAVMLVPQGMAYAMLAGLEPITGLYASTIPTAIYALFGSSRQLAVGPVAMISLLVASAVAPLAGADPVLYAAYASLLMLMVGVMQFAMGVAKLGFLVKYLSHPVIAGFTSAAALIIGFSQLKHILGVPIKRSHHVHSIIAQALSQLGNSHGITVLIAILSIITLVVLKRYAPKWPRFLLVVAGGTLAVWGLQLEQQGVAIVGSVPGGLPMPKMVTLDMNILKALLPSAITISLVGFMESVAVAKAFARQNNYEIDANQELRALGLANLGGAWFSGYPITGGFSRTAVNGQAGAKTPMAGLLTAIFIALSLLFLTPLFHDLPKAVLAAIIMTAVFGLIDFKEAKHLWHLSKPDFALMAITFVATLSLGIEQGIGVGVAASLLWFVMASSKPHVAQLGQLPGTNIFRNIERYPNAHVHPDIVAFRLDAPLFFANTAFLIETVNEMITPQTKKVVIDAGAISHIDATGISTLVELAYALNVQDIDLWLSTVRGPVRDALAHSEFYTHIPKDHIVEQMSDAIPLVAAMSLTPSPS